MSVPVRNTAPRSPTLAYQEERVSIYQADSTNLSFLPERSVDLVVTSPPYNLDVPYLTYADALTYDRYLSWVNCWARALLRVARHGGRACINVPLDTNKGGKQAVYADYLRVFREAGWVYHTT